MVEYVALLRGINLGKRRIKMADLRTAFESWGHSNVRTLLASGNVVVESEESDAAALRTAIEAGLQTEFGYEVPTILRTGDQIRALVASEPFEGIPVTKETRMYITFLYKASNHKLTIPYQSADGSYRILNVDPDYIASVKNLTQTSGTLDAMEILAKEFGNNITTRNWNTVMKIHALLKPE